MMVTFSSSMLLHRAAERLEMENTSQGFWTVPWEQPHWELWNEPPLDMSQLTPEIPFMASLWIKSGYDMKVGKSAETYQVGAHFKALIKAILVAPFRTLEKFFSFHVSLQRCARGWKWHLVRDKNHFIFFTPVTVNKYSLQPEPYRTLLKKA